MIFLSVISLLFTIGLSLMNVPEKYDAKVGTTSQGVKIVLTPNSLRESADALSIGLFTAEYILSKVKNVEVVKAMNGHAFYLHHCDPWLKTGFNLQSKKSEYDYPSDMLNYYKMLSDGRSSDGTYGYGGTSSSATLSCDCDVIHYCFANQHLFDSTLVHEIAHSIMDRGVQQALPSLYQKIQESYDQYMSKNLDDGYSRRNKHEMFATAFEVWMSASRTSRDSPGIDDPEDMKINAPLLYDIMEQIFGPPIRYYVRKLSSTSNLNWNEKQYLKFYIPKYGDTETTAKWVAILAKETGEDAIDTIKEVGGDAIDTIKKTATTVADKTKEIANTVADKTKEVTNTVVSKTKTFVKKLFPW